MALIKASILRKNQENYYAYGNTLQQQSFDFAQMHNAEQVWLCPEDGGTTSYNPVCDFSLTAPNIPLNVYPAIRFQYGKNDGSYGTMDTFWVSGSINDLLQKANASTGGAASTYIVSAISPFS